MPRFWEFLLATMVEWSFAMLISTPFAQQFTDLTSPTLP